MTIIYVKNYANYSDRKIKHSPKDYYALTLQYLSNYITAMRINVNFDMQDGIETEIVVEWSESWTPNYLFACGNESSETMPISSWFVMEFKKIRGRQYRARLKRDVVNDYYENIIEAPSYIEKGTLPIDNDLIFNNEGLTVNQIKKNETLLKDKFGAYYYVAYVTKEAQGTITGTTSDFPYITVSSANNEFVVGQTIHGRETKNKFFFPQYYTLKFTLTEVTTSPYIDTVFKIYFDGAGKNVEVTATNESSTRRNGIGVRNLQSKLQDFISKLQELLMNDIATGYTYLFGEATRQFSDTNKYVNGNSFETLRNYDGKILYDNWIYEGETNDEYYNYSMNVFESNLNSRETTILVNANAYFLQKVKNALSQVGINYNDDAYYLQFRTECVSLYGFNRNLYTPNAEFEITIPSDRKHTEDAPYDIIVIPVGAKLSKRVSPTLNVVFDTDDNIQIALAEKLNSVWTSEGKLKDMQRLPYAPILNEEFVKEILQQQTIFVSGFNTNKDGAYQDITNAVVLFASSKQLTFDININKSINLDPKEFKFNNDCEFMRLVSPNGSGAFDFNIAKNGGTVDYINVDCTFKPGAPYIHLNPNFNRLYATDYNDYRGLICGGDFSIATMTDAWLTYVSENKMYDKIFNRQVQNLDYNQELTLKQQAFFTGVSTVGGAVGGAMKGSMGGVAGAIAGAAMGAAVPATIGVAKNVFTQEAQQEAKSYLIDQYNLNLRNIQARQDTLTKVGADDFNNKIWCTLEEYSCTDIEKEAYLNKIKYNGMTINCIGKIKDYIYNNNISYVQARIIMIDDLSEDDHLIMTIKNEIAMGVYLEGE